MASLADEWGSDPSVVTWVVDRLEEKGLARRQTDASDGRVKLVLLTGRGATVRSEVLEAFHEPPPAFYAWSRTSSRLWMRYSENFRVAEPPVPRF